MDENQNLPKHAWLRVYLPEGGVLLAFTYQERSSGWAARGVSLGEPAEPSGDELYRVLEQPDRVFRLSPEATARVELLSEAEAARLGLPAQPEWLAFFEAPTAADISSAAITLASDGAEVHGERAALVIGDDDDAAVAAPADPAPSALPEAPAEAASGPAAADAAPPAAVGPDAAPPAAVGLGAAPPAAPAGAGAAADDEDARPWRRAAGFVGHFHPVNRDDVEALFFFPNSGRAERLWVRLHGEVPDGFVGELLDTPASPSELAEGSEVLVRAAPGAPLPVYLSPPMQENLRRCVARCQSCDFDLLLLPVGAMLSRALPAGLSAGQVLLTSRCPLCGKTMLVELKGPPSALGGPGPGDDQPGPVTREEAHEVLWAAASFGAFLLLVLVLWLLRPLAQ